MFEICVNIFLTLVIEIDVGGIYDKHLLPLANLQSAKTCIPPTPGCFLTFLSACRTQPIMCCHVLVMCYHVLKLRPMNVIELGHYNDVKCMGIL